MFSLIGFCMLFRYFLVFVFGVDLGVLVGGVWFVMGSEVF